MKYFALIIATLVLSISGCGKKEIDEKSVQIRAGIVYEVNSEKPFSGKVLSTWSSGQKKQERTYKDGIMEGSQTTWYENGALKELTLYIKGKAEGASITYYENGQKKQEANYVQGSLEGVAKTWYESGSKKAEVVYAEGKANGIATQWFEGGQKKQEETYKQGQRVGRLLVWYENGQKSLETVFNEDIQIGPTTEWYENGKQKGGLILPDEPESLTSLWAKSNGSCRGGSGDDINTWIACDERDAIGEKLQSLGWCYGASTWDLCQIDGTTLFNISGKRSSRYSAQIWITAIQGPLMISGLKVNRGNCQAWPMQNFPIRLNFGENFMAQALCDPIEIELRTDRGSAVLQISWDGNL